MQRERDLQNVEREVQGRVGILMQGTNFVSQKGMYNWSGDILICESGLCVRVDWKQVE